MPIKKRSKTPTAMKLMDLRQQIIRLEQALPPQPANDVLVHIEQAKQEWEVTVDSLPQLVCLLDAHKRIIRANRTVELWGLARVVDVKGKEIHTLLHPTCDDGACYLNAFLDRAWLDLAKGVSAEGEAQDHLLGRYLYLQMRSIPLQMGFRDKVSHSFATLVIQDISDRRRLEEALRRANEDLEQRVEERTHQLQRIALENARLYETQRTQYRRLQESQDELIRIEKMAALGRLVASIAHEINNPLQSVQGFLNLLEEELSGRQRQQKLTYYLGIATGEIERISVIVRRMRDFYRTVSTEQPTPDSLDNFYRSTQTELQVLDLHATLDSVLLLANKKLQHSHIRVEHSWVNSLPLLQANPDHLKQVFLNLALNAIDAMPHGGVFSIRTTMEQASLNDGPSQAVVRIEFSDTGIGMSAQTLAHLFEPLFTTKEQGSGFGLFTSYKIIEAHQGQITAVSQVGQGTTFIILLPLSSERSIADANS